MMLMAHLDNLTNLISVQHVSSDSDAMSEFPFNYGCQANWLWLPIQQNPDSWLDITYVDAQSNISFYFILYFNHSKRLFIRLDMHSKIHILPTLDKCILMPNCPMLACEACKQMQFLCVLQMRH